MDLNTARAALPAISRSTFGEMVTITPGINGEGGWLADSARLPFEAIVHPVFGAGDSESVSGGRKAGWLSRVAIGPASIEIDIVAYPAARDVQVGDRIEASRRDASFEIDRIDRQGRDRHVWSLVRL